MSEQNNCTVVTCDNKYIIIKFSLYENIKPDKICTGIVFSIVLIIKVVSMQM